MTGTAPAPQPDPTPERFRVAVQSLHRVEPRSEITLTAVQPPQRLAPYSHALAARLEAHGRERATARLILLHDPDGQQGWNGTLRLVVYLRAEVEAELAADALLPSVGWSWLTDALEDARAGVTALGGTVTVTSSARFGEIPGPERTDELELRASWTPLDDSLYSHGYALCELLTSAAGLPPAGVAQFGPDGCA